MDVATLHQLILFLGKIFITDDKGTLIADSLGGLKLILNELDSSPVQQPVLPNATDHKDPTVRRAAQFLIHKFGSFSAIPDGDHSLTVCTSLCHSFLLQRNNCLFIVQIQWRNSNIAGWTVY